MYQYTSPVHTGHCLALSVYQTNVSAMHVFYQEKRSHLSVTDLRKGKYCPPGEDSQSRHLNTESQAGAEFLKRALSSGKCLEELWLLLAVHGGLSHLPPTKSTCWVKIPQVTQSESQHHFHRQKDGSNFQGAGNCGSREVRGSIWKEQSPLSLLALECQISL